MAREYARAYGAGWLERVSNPDQRATWRERYEDEVMRRPGVLAVPPVGLEYSELYELIDIAKNHWQPIAPALGKQADILPLLKHVRRIRNTPAHSRDVVPFERELLSGIAGEVRSRVTVHMTTQGPDGDPYPRIESVVDSFGDAATMLPYIGEIAGGSKRHTLLSPGDIVNFTCVGLDPRGRDLHWYLESPRGAEGRTDAPSGEPATLTWHVTEKHIMESVFVGIYMSAVGATYHRAGHFDHRVYFQYRVRNPGDI